ncbi:MAG: inositol monophosphatase [Acidobacteria bacterium]|nr:inositol monophosphatase [Acidobacteriota bacterium]
MTSIDIADVKEVVREAGQLALLYYGKVSKSLKADLSVVTEADAAIEGFLRMSLTALAPDFGYIAEDTEQLREPGAGEDRCWVVDALDGTQAFAAGLPNWTPAVCIMKGSRPIAGAAVNPITRELFWTDEGGPAYCNDEILQPDLSVELEPNTLIFAPTNHHRILRVDFPGRLYSLGPPIYQLCLLAKGTVKGLVYSPTLALWDLALPVLMLQKTGAIVMHLSGQPVDLSTLMDRSTVPEPIVAGSAEMVAILRQRVTWVAAATAGC